MKKPKSKMLNLKKIEGTLLFLILLLLPTQLGKHFWPDFSYIFSLKIDYLSPTIYLWDVLVAILLIVWILIKPQVNRLALNIFLLFIFSQTLSLLGSEKAGVGLVRLQQYIIAGLFGVYMASQDFSNLLQKVYLPLSLAIFGEGLIAILQFIFGSTLGLWILGERAFNISTPGIAKFDYYGMQFLRPYGTFSHPNVLASFMLIAALIVNGKINKHSKPLQILVSVFASLTIFFTMSRVAMVAGFICALLFLRKNLFLVATIVLLLSPVLLARYLSVLNFDNLTFIRREQLIETSLQVFIKYPLTGAGLNNFIPTIAGQLVSGPSRFLQPVHNIFLLALSETGIIGLLGLIFLIGFPILRIIKLNPKPYTLYPILLPWFIIFFLGMFDHYFLTLPQGYRMLFLVWGLSFSMLK